MSLIGTVTKRAACIRHAAGKYTIITAAIPTCAAADNPAKALARSRLRMATMVADGQGMVVQPMSVGE